MTRRARRGVVELSGLRDVRTMNSSKKRSIPTVQSSTYLDLYMLGKEKDRLEKEVYILEKRKKSIQKRLNEISEKMKKLEEVEAGRCKANNTELKKLPEKELKVMSLKY